MSGTRGKLRALTLVMVLVTAPLTVTVGMSGTAAAGNTLSVGAAGNTGYASIQSAVDNATDGDRIEVRPGTYGETVTIDKNVTLVAPNGATVVDPTPQTRTYDRSFTVRPGTAPTIRGFGFDGTGFGDDTSAVRIEGDATPTIEDITILPADAEVGYNSAIIARGTTGDWTLRNVTIRGGGYSSLGGISASSSTGNWSVVNLTATNLFSQGIDARKSDGAWTVTDSRITNTSFGVYAIQASGQWRVEQTVLTQNRMAGIDASNAVVTGNATRNYWGATDGPSGAFNGTGDAAVGNLTIRPFYSDTLLTNRSDRTSNGGNGDGSNDGNTGGGNSGGSSSGGSSGGIGGVGAGSTGGTGGTSDGSDTTADSNDGGQDQSTQTETTNVATEIRDDAPSETGTTVDVDGTDVVQTVTFESGVTGQLEVTEYEEPPTDVSDSIAASDAIGDAESDNGDSVEIVTAVDISPTDSTAEETAATIGVTVPESELDDPDAAVVLHETGTGWEQLDATVESVSDGTVSLTARTESFSTFAVVERTDEQQQTATPTGPQTTTDSSTATTTERDTPKATTTAPESGTGTPAETTSGSGPGFGSLVAVLAILATTFLARFRAAE